MIFQHYQRIWYLGRNRWRLFAHDGSTSKNHSSFDSPNKEELKVHKYTKGNSLKYDRTPKQSTLACHTSLWSQTIMVNYGGRNRFLYRNQLAALK